MGQGLPVSVLIGGNRERGYRLARRHSALVRFLRVALPVGALMAAVVLVAMPYIRPLKLLATDIDIGSLALDGTRITMEMPDLKGFRGDNKPYSISARQAIQDVTRPNILELLELSSRIETKPGSVARLRSDAGVYDSKKDVLSVTGNVQILSGTSDIRMRSGVIDFKANSVISKEPVEVVMSTGKIDANAMSVFDNGNRIVFKGHVRSHFESRPQGHTPLETGAGASE